jgi:hypothetical protein
MSGLLSDVLPFLYSQGDRAKRYMNGLLADPVGTMQQTAGGIVDAGNAQQGLLGQAFGDPQRPFLPTDTSALGQAADNTFQGVMGFAPAGITVYHGSPHVFDKFDSSKIGTGEGAQAYGHGIYTAESPDVAARYRATLTNFRPDHIERSLVDKGVSPDVANTYAQYAASTGGAKASFEEFAKQASETAPSPYIEQFRSRVRAELPKVKAALGDVGGALYKVDLPDSAVAKMLDWDKPLSQQAPEVQAAAQNLPAFARNADTGADFYKMLAGTSVGPRYSEAATMLQQQGIPGIRYLDGGSRADGAGTSNFVVFPGQESLLNILERNGQPLK